MPELEHYIYFAKKKLEGYYDSLVKRTEVTLTKKSTKEGSGKVEIKFKTKVGPFLSLLRIADADLEAGASAAGKLASSREVVSQFNPAQKLKAILLMLEEQDRLDDFDDWVQRPQDATTNQYVIFSLELKVDPKQSEADIKSTNQVIFRGETSQRRVIVKCSLGYLERPNAWRRLDKPVHVRGFGTAIHSSSAIEEIQIDPIVFAYDTGD